MDMKSNIHALGFSLGALVAGTTAVQAQVSQYTFSQSVETYTEISAADGGYQLGTPTWDPPLHNLRAYADPANPDGTVTNGGYLAPAVGPGYPIGFNFTYNGESFDRVGIAHGGWISFGKSEDGNQAVSVFTSDHPAGRPLSHSYNSPSPAYKRNRIAVGNSQLRQVERSPVDGPTSEFRVATVGTAPNRVCVIQWKDFGTTYSFEGTLVNFQIRLNEVDNSVDIRFGEMTWPSTLGSGSYQIGLGGSNNTDYNNRQTLALEPSFLYDWNQTVAGTDSVSQCVLAYDDPFNAAYSGVIPVNGLNFHWAPPNCPPPAWPVSVTEIGYDRASVNWSYPDGTESFDYVIATIDDPADPNAIMEGNTEEVGILVEGLEPLTYYYVFVRSNCADGPGAWSAGTRFRSNGGALLECGGAILTEEYCYATDDYIVWTYSTSNGSSPVRLELLAGSIVGPNTLEIFNGPDTLSPLLWSTANGGSIPGQLFTSTGSYLTVYLSAPSNGSCEVHEFVAPFEWTVGCLDCAPPLAAFSLGEVDCEAEQYEVSVNIVNMGSATTLAITNSQNATSVPAPATGSYTVGPFTAGVPVTLTLVNAVNELCNLESVVFINPPCVVTSCGPDDYTYCYGPQDPSQWLFAGDGQAIGIRWRSGVMGFGDAALVYDGNDPFAVTPDEYTGNLGNVLQWSTNVDNSLLLAIDAGEGWSCEEAPDYSQTWDYVVACYDGCTQPEASFTVVEDCDNEQFSVTVNISVIGSAGSVQITNDGGAPTVAAAAVGTYTVGPFASMEVVNIEVEGASVLCSWSSGPRTLDCTGVGIEETLQGRLTVVPNPSNGMFRVNLPEGNNGDRAITVLDTQGRLVNTQRVDASNATSYDMDLSALPSGVYMVTVQNERERYTGMIQIVH
jgi:hypothetical protein